MDYTSNPVKQYEIRQLQSTLKQADYTGKPELNHAGMGGYRANH
jgi:hypothetical protein